MDCSPRRICLAVDSVRGDGRSVLGGGFEVEFLSGSTRRGNGRGSAGGFGKGDPRAREATHRSEFAWSDERGWV
jgi:hypothetical protein